MHCVSFNTAVDVEIVRKDVPHSTMSIVDKADQKLV